MRTDHLDVPQSIITMGCRSVWLCLWHLTVQFVIRAAREVYMMAGEFLFFKKENLSGRWRGLNDYGFVYVSE